MLRYQRSKYPRPAHVNINVVVNTKQGAHTVTYNAIRQAPQTMMTLAEPLDRKQGRSEHFTENYELQEEFQILLIFSLTPAVRNWNKRSQQPKISLKKYVSMHRPRTLYNLRHKTGLKLLLRHMHRWKFHEGYEGSSHLSGHLVPRQQHPRITRLIDTTVSPVK